MAIHSGFPGMVSNYAHGLGNPSGQLHLSSLSKLFWFYNKLFGHLKVSLKENTAFPITTDYRTGSVVGMTGTGKMSQTPYFWSTGHSYPYNLKQRKKVFPLT